MASGRDADDWEVSPTELLEQAFHLLRTLPADALAWCVVGPLPFVLGLLFFWSDMSRSGDAALSAFGWAVGLTLLFAWLKITQGLFARAVWARLLPEDGLPPLRPGAFLRRTAALLFLSAFALPLELIAANLLLPFGWIYATFQNAVVFAYTQEFDHRCCRRLLGLSARVSHHEPLSNHLLLLLLFMFGFMVWGALFSAGLVLPFLLKILTGVESVFTRNPMAAAFNSLYLAVVSVAWMLVSPLFRVAYVLRNFHARSRPTGLDLLSRLIAVRRRASAAAMLLALVAQVGLASPVRADDPPATPPAAGNSSESQLGRAIKRTLAQREYQWRLPPAAAESKESSLQAAIRQFFGWIRGLFRDLDRFINELIDKLLRGRSMPAPDGSGRAGLDPSALRGMVYLLGALLLCGVLWVGVRWLVSRRRQTPGPVVGGPAGLPVDLTSEETLASQLPEDEWMRLARDQLAGGETRLAVRALFLAILSSLGEQRLIEINRAKSNLDYRNEVRLRTLSRREVPELFNQSVSVFERVWYGLHEALPQWVQQLMDTYDQIKRAPVP